MMSSGPRLELGYGAGAMRRGLPAPSSQAAVLVWDMMTTELFLVYMLLGK